MIFNKNGQASINRKEMRAIKQMDHKQIEEVLETAFEKGYQRALEKREESKNIKKIYEMAVIETLDSFKGIGEKRRETFLFMYKEKIEQILMEVDENENSSNK